MTESEASARDDPPRRSLRRAPALAVRETIDVRTRDGWHLRADVDAPAGDPIGTAVLAHAILARRTAFDRPAGSGVRRRLVEAGWRVVAFDFRGHGDSGPRSEQTGPYAYDDFVLRDLPAIHDFARASARQDGPVVLVGHSLGGNAGLAAQGAGLLAFDRIVAVAASLWMPQFEPSAVRWTLRRALLGAVAGASRKLGRFPARALRLSSDDLPAACWSDMNRFARTGRWTSADGSADYLAGLSRVTVPVLQLVSAGDRFACTPDNGERFLARCGGPRKVVRILQADDGSPAPGHMQLVTGGRIESVWDRVRAWMADSEGDGGRYNGGP